MKIYMTVLYYNYNTDKQNVFSCKLHVVARVHACIVYTSIIMLIIIVKSIVFFVDGVFTTHAALPVYIRICSFFFTFCF